MKWAESRKHFPDYSTWQDLLQVMLVTLILSIIAALVISLLLIIMNPKVAMAGDITNFRSARRLSAPKPAIIMLCEVSAYSPTAEECSGNPFITASGKRVYVGGIAADPKVLPLGSRVIIPNYNNGEACTVVDTGSYIKGNRLDVFLWKTEDAIHWGRRRGVRVEVLYVPKAAT